MAWNETPAHLVREFQFADFREAIAFLNRVAEVAEAHGHHPEIFNVYGTVRLTLTTHDAGNTVTDKDHKLAAAIDAVVDA